MASTTAEDATATLHRVAATPVAHDRAATKPDAHPEAGDPAGSGAPFVVGIEAVGKDCMKLTIHGVTFVIDATNAVRSDSSATGTSPTPDALHVAAPAPDPSKPPPEAMAASDASPTASHDSAASGTHPDPDSLPSVPSAPDTMEPASGPGATAGAAPPVGSDIPGPATQHVSLTIQGVTLVIDATKAAGSNGPDAGPESTPAPSAPTASSKHPTDASPVADPPAKHRLARLLGRHDPPTPSPPPPKR